VDKVKPQQWYIDEGKKLSRKTKQKPSDLRARPYPAFKNRKMEEIIPAGENLKKMCLEHGLGVRCMNDLKNGKQKYHGDWVLLDGQEDK